ncbi:hypothetical protein Nepgr_022379 [Nepenthes gracilis]|uniref:Uncharacterized protein n=1 Tax=Nepenthes gracilis TaxID=150966 RepID=A0AAD3SYM1_NEPGR|nr:hypothetical protein Nepgr_022379 [Nepenthes gracilis]
MATNLLTFHPIRACATAGNRNPDNHRRTSSSAKWYSPLFGWSSDPDYIDSTDNSSGNNSQAPVKSETRSEIAGDRKSARSRFSPGCFTEEKARQLRMMTMDTESFHDAMYHSPIASRLASDFSDR